jgi:hypothetical protein
MALSDKAGNSTLRAEVNIEFEQKQITGMGQRGGWNWHAETIGDQENPEALKRNVAEQYVKGKNGNHMSTDRQQDENMK